MLAEKRERAIRDETMFEIWEAVFGLSYSRRYSPLKLFQISNNCIVCLSLLLS